MSCGYRGTTGRGGDHHSTDPIAMGDSLRENSTVTQDAVAAPSPGRVE